MIYKLDRIFETKKASIVHIVKALNKSPKTKDTGNSEKPLNTDNDPKIAVNVII